MIIKNGSNKGKLLTFPMKLNLISKDSSHLHNFYAQNSSPSTAITTADEQKQSPIQPFEQLSVIYPNHLYDIVIGTSSNNGIAFSNIGAVSTSGNRQKQQVFFHTKTTKSEHIFYK
jgi:hypothetical protein